jgi:hypothetical protein
MQPFQPRTPQATACCPPAFSGETMTNIVLGTVAIVAAATFAVTTADSASADHSQPAVVSHH